jgi:hypothetical protein
VVEKVAQFNIKIDSEAPKVTRIYANSGILTLVTNEDAECFYSLDSKAKCSFEVENASEMIGQGLLHTYSFDKGISNYIKCKDNFGHSPGDCTIIIKAGTYGAQTL